MNKEFVTYEQALALKELGFDEISLAYWYNEEPTNQEGQCLVYYKKPWDDERITKSVITRYYWAPLKQQVFRWFREKYKLVHEMKLTGVDTYFVIIHRNTLEYLQLTSNDNTICVAEVVDCYSYEEAEDACIDKLIEITKNSPLV